MNTVTVTGNLTRDPEIRFLKSGTPLCTLGVAVNRRWQNRQTQEWEEQVSFFDVVCWQAMAQNIGDTLSKGDRVVVTGRLDYRVWETDEGEKRSKVEITAEDVAVSLRWAKAEVSKNPKSDSSGSEPTGSSLEDPFA